MSADEHFHGAVTYLFATVVLLVLATVGAAVVGPVQSLPAAITGLITGALGVRDARRYWRANNKHKA